MKFKKCNNCGKIKSLDKFNKNERCKDKYSSWCKYCHSEYSKQWYKNNFEKCKEQGKKWVENNRDRMRELQKNWQKINPEKAFARIIRWRKKNPDKVKKMAVNRYKKRRANISYRLSDQIKNRINRSLKGSKGGRPWEEVVGYTLQDLMNHLEKQFKSGMSWSNYGKWHIDHIKPISSFNFNSYKDKEFRECWALENLQPLWSSENISKGVKILRRYIERCILLFTR